MASPRIDMYAVAGELTNAVFGVRPDAVTVVGNRSP